MTRGWHNNSEAHAEAGRLGGIQSASNRRKLKRRQERKKAKLEKETK